MVVHLILFPCVITHSLLNWHMFDSVDHGRVIRSRLVVASYGCNNMTMTVQRGNGCPRPVG